MMPMAMGEFWSKVGSIAATLMFINAIVQQYFPYQLRGRLDKYTNKLLSYIYPYIQITFQEYTGNGFKRSEVYDAIRNYLSVKTSDQAKRLKASDIKDNKSLVLSPADNEEVTDEFNGVKLWWTSYARSNNKNMMSFYPNTDEKRGYKLTFSRRHKDLIMPSYLFHIVNEGKTFEIMNKQRKLYTNGSGDNWGYDGKRTKWIHVPFQHPATFDTLAMDPELKKKILNDLTKFRNGKDYYAKVGKPWKRGYLLYGPPGTGKSTMISAMANFLDYDVYDLELTAVKDNTDLKKLLIDSSNKSIMVIEDIDCSLDLTGQRDKDKKKRKSKDKKKKKDPAKKMSEEMEDGNKSKVTLSGLLNFIDGIWSACGGERVIVFTTNHVDKLDPALIRRGRMDMHIELSYCSFEAFKVLAKNYLDVDSHETFAEIERLLGETDMNPADVAENLMPKSEEDDKDLCLKNLIEALEQAKVDAKQKAEEEARLKAEEEKEAEEEEEEEEKKRKAKEEDKKSDDESEKRCAKCNGKLDKDIKENGSVKD